MAVRNDSDDVGNFELVKNVKKSFFLILHMKTHIKMQNINSGEPKTKLSVNFASFSDKCNECEK